MNIVELITDKCKNTPEYVNNKMRLINCNNCGRMGHIYKACYLPIISYGIILIHIDLTIDIKDFISQLSKFNYIENNGEIPCQDEEDLLIYCDINEKIKFLMIQRKHSFGYIEFVRGKYEINETENLIFIFKQMTPKEIKTIRESTNFDDLWYDIWSKQYVADKKFFIREYNESKEKYDSIKNKINCDADLNFYVNNVTPTWNITEWGFPKGRRDKGETDLMCAIREVREETNINEDKFILLKNMENLNENVYGTNRKNYQYTYYLAIVPDYIEPFIDVNNDFQTYEIENIKWHTYSNVIGLIRPHYVNKKKIITSIYTYMVSNLISYIKKKSKEISQ